ncbi:uncharacterized protein [Periplaneta americana]|uniref:uncharacterized protein n=1 Tax=Periplaneta americana TaxID=6978 RepID=UPI0037E9B02E
MGDRRNKKTRAKRSSDYFKSEESTETKGEETRGDMGRARHLESPGGSSRDSGSRDQKRKRPTKERWLLTRKTWRYMADAGRRLIPEGAHNRHEDIPKIEAYFQEVCHREPKFLLWRKSSYPGALGFRSHHRKNRGRKKGGSCREKASSADEADAMKIATTGGRLDLQKLKQEFLYGPSTSGSDSSYRQKSYIGSKGHLPDVPETTVTSPDNEEEETERELTETLSKYLSLQERSGDTLSPGEDIADIDYQRLLDQLRKYLSSSNILEDQPETLTTKARKARTQGQGKTLRTTDQRPLTPSPPPLSVSFEGDTPERMTLDILRRYYSRSTCRQKVITDLLTDRKLLEKLYFDLRQTRGFKAGSRGMGRGGSGFVPMTWRKPEHTTLRSRREGEEFCRDDDEDDYDDGKDVGSWKRLGKTIPRAERELSPLSPPPLIEIQHEVEAVDRGIQTDPIPASVLVAIEDELKKSRISAAMEMKEEKSGAGRRRSSVDNDDVSPSVSDTIKRYLRMARKKSIDADKVDRFKRVNYDRNLRNIKPKGEITMPGDDDGLHKGCQPEESWIPALKELKLEDIISDPDISPGGDDLSGSRITSSRSSLDGTGISDDALLSPPPMHVGGKHNPHPSGILSTGQTFLSNLLHGLQYHQQQQQNNEGTATVIQSSTSAATSVGGAAMQKSKSSSSVVHHGTRVAKKIWRSRSKSHSRAISSTTSTWTPQGHCCWTNVTGRQVTLTDTSLLSLCELERRMLQKVAVAKLQALNLGVAVRIPSETVVSVSHKPKRRPYLLKRKALTTGFFDTSRGKDDKDKDNGGGLVFGIPIGLCLENDRLSRMQRGGSPGRDEPSELRRKSHHGSRSSFSSLIETTTARGDESGSCESLMSPGDRMAGSVPGLLDTLSCGSTADIATAAAAEPSIPQLVQSCFRHLENFGLHTLGIFRVSSSKKRVRQLREDFDCGKEINLGEDHCPHDVATLLKEFFRDLPEPLLCRDLYQAFVQTQKIRNRRLQFEALQHLVQLLPVPNRDTLWALLNFLVNVARNSEDHKDETGEWVTGSKMDSNNLATVFAPNILHCIKPGSNKELSTERAEERIDVINVIRSMIDHNKELFQVPAELLDEVYLHMMDSHPEALDQLLRKRGNLGDDLLDDLESSVIECGSSESSSVPRIPTQIAGEMQEPHLAVTFGESEDHSRAARRVWSREEFLHETAGMGGPDVSMRPRHKDRDRGRERSSKKRWREEPLSRRKADSEGGADFPRTGFGITTSASASQISLSSNQKSAILSQQLDASAKTRSASVDGGHTVTVPVEQGDHMGRLFKVFDDDNTDQSSRRQSSPLVSDTGGSAGGIITASLKIPVPSVTTSTSFALNLDDADIPYIEDAGGGGYTVTTDGGRQHMTIGLVRRTASGEGTNNSARRRRQRSASGSDSSQASTSVQPPGSMYHQQACDSALGSTATFSSPPRNTTPSICSSDAGHFSSPPSWASTPPTSPDALGTTVNFIPEELTTRIQQHHSQTARISIATTKAVTTQVTSTTQASLQKITKEVAPVILQKVTFTSTSELQQVQRSDTASDRQLETRGSKTTVTHKVPPTVELPKSASTPAVHSSLKKSVESEPVGSDKKLTTSISSIGGAVMRSKTADIERMLRIKGTETSKVKNIPVLQPQQTPGQDDKKKYSKRRYTDSRHQTRHIPDSEALREASSGEGGGASEGAASRQRKTQQGPVWKRRELIASDPKDHESVL